MPFTNKHKNIYMWELIVPLVESEQHEHPRKLRLYPRPTWLEAL
jgi:hypothetical protein